MIQNKNLLVAAAALVLLVVLIALAFLIPSPAEKSTPPQETVTPPSTEGTAPLQTQSQLRQELTVGICLPAEIDAWTATGAILQKQLSQRGYTTELVYGDGTAKAQNQLLLELVKKNVSCIVLAPVDSAAMTEAGTAALEKDIPILSYGALLMDTEAVSGYICYDYFEMGADLARYIEKKLSLSNAAKAERSFTMELFMGSPEDYNAVLLHQGLLSELEPYLTLGTLECKSHRTAFEDSCIFDWSETAAEKACDSRLRHYPEGKPDIMICASDSIAAGVIRSLEKRGITTENMPLITGNGATSVGLANLAAGKQALTVKTDSAVPAEVCCAMVDWVVLGQKPTFPLIETYNNVKNIPTALCGFTIVEGE